jgi:hypothetical protein
MQPLKSKAMKKIESKSDLVAGTGNAGKNVVGNEKMNTVRYALCISFVLFFLSSVNVFSQNRPSFGMSFGLNESFWRGEMDEFASEIEEGMRDEGFAIDLKEVPRFGINIGFTINYQIKKWIMIQSEVNYINEGTKLKGTCNIEGIDINLKMALNVNYINIPLLVKFITPSGWYLSAGPYADIKAYAKMRVTASAMGESESDAEKLPNVNVFNYGLTGGLGYQNDEIGIEFRYLHGLKSVLSEEAESYQFRNSVFELKMDIYFGN